MTPPILDYSDLLAKVFDWFQRSDLDDKISDFVRGWEDYANGMAGEDILPNLSYDAPTNWLLQQRPMAYLYGTIWQGLLYLNDPRADAILEIAKTMANGTKPEGTWKP